MRPPYCRRTKQSGYVLVLTVILLGLFLSLAAAAIDMGNLYVWQLRLDKAVRAGAVAGIGYRASKGWTTIYGGPPDYVNPRLATAGSEMANLLATADKVVRETFRVSFPASMTDWASVENTVRNSLEPCDSSYATCFKIVDRSAPLLEAAPNAYDPKEDKIDLYYRYEVPTFFAGKLKGVFGSFPMCEGAGDKCLVKTHQTAQLDYANIIMLLDVSGSIEQQRITQTLRDSATAFYTLFNPFRDRISLIEFNLGAKVSFGFQQQAQNIGDRTRFKASFGINQNTWDAFTGAIQNIQPKSNTNPCDALSNAMTELNWLYSQRTISHRSALRPYLVFFTDGAPNAFRGIFKNMSNWEVAGNPGSPSSDWYQYAIEWVDPSAPSSTYQGPSPLIKAGPHSLFDLTPEAKEPPNDPSKFTGGNDYCGDIWSNSTVGAPTYFEQALNATRTSSDPRRPGCLTNLNFSIPNGSPRVISVPASTVSGETEFRVPNGGQTDQKYLELPFYCAIEAADQIRVDFGGTIFAIGLGDKAGEPLCNDPLQIQTDKKKEYFVRKDNFLSRLAFDPYTGQGSTWGDPFKFSPRARITLNSKCANSRKNTEVSVGYDLSSGARTPDSLGATNGQYYPTDKADDLPGIFSQVAKEILLRLNS